jgi:Holliday junction DNA helicase RuvB
MEGLKVPPPAAREAMASMVVETEPGPAVSRETAPASLDDLVGQLVARGSRDTPREALGLLSAVRDQVELDGLASIDAATVTAVLQSLEIDPAGLGRIDREYLAALRGAGRPLSLETLADRLGKSRAAIERVHEPFLVRRGLVIRTPAGRALAA